jgi:regulator of RNase E activity RraA
MLVLNGRESVVRKASCWKGIAVQRGLEHRRRGIVIAGAVTRQLLVKTLQAGKYL